MSIVTHTSLPMLADQTTEAKTIAGVWRRLGAVFLDSVGLGILGAVAGALLTAQFVGMGPWGRLLGFSVACAYFGVLNSGLAGGQTLGKRLLRIKVVGQDGAPLPLSKALLRYLPLGTPWFLNNAQFGDSVLSAFWLPIALSVVIFGVGVSVAYMFLFNRRTRQSVHDLLVGSYVVASDASGPVTAPAVWRGHLAVCLLLLLVSGAAPYFAKGLEATEPFAALAHTSRAVNDEPWVVSSQVARGQTSTMTAGKSQSSTTYLAITAYSKDPDIENAERARTLARLALSIDSSAASLDVIQVTLVYGYDIGIASWWRSQDHTKPPAKW